MLLLIISFCSFALSLHDNDILTVYQLLTPLFYEKYGNESATIDAYHGGVAFVNQNSSEEFTFELIADPSFLGSFLPEIKENELFWHNNALIRISQKFIRNHWTTIERVYEITGKQLNEIRDWAEKYQTLYPKYVLFDVAVGEKDYFVSNNCQDFMKACLVELVKIGAEKVTEKKTIKVDEIKIFSENNPTKMDYEKEKDEIIDFYTRLENVFNVTAWDEPSIEKAVKDCIEILRNQMIYFYENNYYHIKVIDPYIYYRFIDWNLP